MFFDEKGIYLAVYSQVLRSVAPLLSFTPNLSSVHVTKVVGGGEEFGVDIEGVSALVLLFQTNRTLA